MKKPIGKNDLEQENEPALESIINSIQDFDENRFRFALEASDLGAWDLDVIHSTAWRSLRHDQIFGYEELVPEWTYEMFLGHVLEEDREQVDTCFKDALEKRQEWEFECRIRRVDNEVRWIWAKARSLFNPEGQPVRMFGLVQDITERKKIEESKLKAVGMLAGGIAHDFNNILGIILGNLSLLQSVVGDDAESVTLCRESEKAAIRGKNLTKQLLTFATGGDPVRKTAILEDVIKDASEFVLSGTNTKIDFHITPDCPPLDIDVGQISQVIQNLIINANQAMEEGGRITISTGLVSLRNDDEIPLKDGDYVEISIKDDGSGIPEKLLSQIFNPFFTTKEKGVGLGLSTSYSIIKKHDGHISVDSILNKGTTFTIYLPLTDTPAQKMQKDHSAVSEAKAKILFMDDEVSLQKIVKRTLEKHGHSVDVASDGEEALSKYSKALGTDSPFSLVILDLTIPGGFGGKKTVDALLQLDPEVKAIVCSGYSTDPILAKFEEYGFKYALEKPFAPSNLLEAIDTVLKEK